MEKASALSKKRNLEGNHDSAPNPLSNNSFAVLSDNQMVAKDSLMGVKIPDGNFAVVDLEVARNSLVSRQRIVNPSSATLFIESNEGTTTPLSMDWISSDDNEDTSFTLVENRKTKNMRKKSNVSASRPITRSQRNKKLNLLTVPCLLARLVELDLNLKKLQ
jgi:hypothetical protein